MRSVEEQLVSASGIQTAVVTGNTPTTTTTQDYTVSGFGTPQAAIVFCSVSNSSNNPELYVATSIGFTDGTTDANSQVMEDNVGSLSNTARKANTTNLISLTDAAGTEYLTGNWNTWVTDGIQIDWTAVDGTKQYNLAVMLIGNCNSAYVGSEALATGANDITSPGFKPNIVFFSSIASGGSTVATVAGISFGAAHNSSTNTVTEGNTTYGDNDNVATHNTGCGTFDNSCISGSGNRGQQVWSASASAFDASGFTLTTTGADPSTDKVFYLALDTGDTDGVSIDIVDSPTSTGTWDVTAPGFAPQSVIMSQSGSTVTNTDVSADPVFWGLSMFDDTNESGQCISVDDGGGITDVESSFSSTNAVNTYEFGGSTHDLMHQGSFTSFDSSGYNMSFPTYVDGTARKWLSIAFDSTTDAIASTTLSGTALPYITASDIVTGGKTIVIGLINDTWIAAGTGPIGTTAQTQAIIDGLTSAQTETLGWNNEVRDKEVTTALVRTSSTVATITLTASSAYVITAGETITATIPAAVLTTSSGDLVASPTVDIGGILLQDDAAIDWDFAVASASGSTTVVTTEAEFDVAVAAASAGSVILLGDGTHSWGAVTIDCSGSVLDPVIITAQNAGMVTLNGVSITLTGSGNVIGGFEILNSTRVFDVKGQAIDNRLTDITFTSPGYTLTNKSSWWFTIGEQSHRLRFDHNTITNYKGAWRIYNDVDSFSNGFTTDCRYDHNTLNGCDYTYGFSAVQIGVTDNSFLDIADYPAIMTTGVYNNFTCDNNYFEDLRNSSVGVFQNKSSGNIWKDNEIYNCTGGLDHRDGGYCEYYRNYIHGPLGSGRAIRVTGDHVSVYNNIIDCPNKIALNMPRWGNRAGTQPLFPTHNNFISFNTIIDYGYWDTPNGEYGLLIGLQDGGGNTGTKERIYSCTVSNNIIVGNHSSFSGNEDQCMRYEISDYSGKTFTVDNDVTFDNNIYYATNSSTAGDTSYDANAILTDPAFAADGFTPTVSSTNLISSAVVTVPAITTDYNEVTRGGGTDNDIGAVEYVP